MQQQPPAAQAGLIQFGAAKRAANFVLGLVAGALQLWSWLVRKVGGQREEKAVLLIEPFGLGDIISFEPLVRALADAGVEVRLCARAEWRELFPQPKVWVDAHIPWGSHAAKAKYRWADYCSARFRAFLKELRRAGRGAVGVDTRGDIRSVLLLHLAGCREVVSLSTYLGSNARVPAGAARRVPFEAQSRRWEVNASFLPALGVNPREPLPPPFFPHLAAPGVASRRRIGLIPVAPWPGKWWESSKWAALIEQLRRAHWEISALCGPGQIDLARAQLGEGVHVTECRSVGEWAAALNEQSVVITLDTGPMHLAAALGRPVVALFGQGLLPLWAPSGPASRVVTHQSDPDFVLCLPVEANTHLGERFMRRIQVAEVLQAVEDMDEAGGKKPQA